MDFVTLRHWIKDTHKKTFEDEPNILFMHRIKRRPLNQI